MGDELDQTALQQFLDSAGLPFGKIIAIQQYKGGYSNLTYLIKFAEKEIILRKGPNNVQIKGAHNMAREYGILAALQGHFAVPNVLQLCSNTQILGTEFYLMEKVDGLILRPQTIKQPLGEDKMRQLSTCLIDTLARLHQIDLDATGLGQLGKADGYVERQLEGWIGRYQNSKIEGEDGFEPIISWLQSHKPRPQAPAFLHNDFKYDNVIFDEHFEKILAVLDWEMATVGDPLMDLGAMLAYWVAPQEGPFMKSLNITWLNGNLSRKQLVERYAQATQRDMSDVLFYYVFGLFKNTVILQQIYQRWLSGKSKDERFGQLAHGVAELNIMAQKAIENNSI